MLRSILIVSTFFFSMQAFADQWLMMNKKQSAAAESILQKYIGKPMLFFCGCCTDDKGEIITLTGVSAKPFSSPYLQDKGELYVVNIQFINEKGQPNSGNIDLAYAWLQVKDKAMNVAELCKLQYDACVNNVHFAWKNRSKPALPARKKKPH